MTQPPAAFMSYSHRDDECDGQYLTQFRARLAYTVSQYLGTDFEIFQDRKDIAWGQNWKRRLDESLDAVTFLIAILTPTFFQSEYCRKEVERFLEREKKLQRDDLILPVYYIDTPLVNDATRQANDPLARAIGAHQYVDWRELRYDPFEVREVRKALASLAVHVRDALQRVAEAQLIVPPPERKADTALPTHEAEVLKLIEPGQIRRGVVSHLTTFGALIDLGGADGLVLVSELAHERINHPREVLHIGQEVDVYVLSVDKASKKIELSIKKAVPDPWKTVAQRSRVGEVVSHGYLAICSRCGRDTMVPFVPTGDKPLYCSDCYERGYPLYQPAP